MPLPPRKRKLVGRLQRIRAYVETRWRAQPLRDTESWSPGDLAECVVQGIWESRCGHRLDELCKGEVHIVRAVRYCADRNGVEGQYLAFARWPSAMFIATCFRKLTPRADALEAADAAFLEQLQPAALPADTTAAIRPIAHRPRRIFP